MNRRGAGPQPDAARQPTAAVLRASALRAAAAGAAALAAALWFAGTPPGTAGYAMALYAAVCVTVVATLDAHHPFGRFGPANVITLARAILACVVAAMVVAPAPTDAWWFTVFLIVAVALALDGIDGWIARYTGLASPFGARFDMEVDALLILILSASAWIHGKVGAWVLLLGLMRYVFVAAGLVLPTLRRPLPPSVRRQAVCVLQIGALGLLLLPALTPPVSGVVALLALGLLVWSFAVDVVWLLNRRGAP